MTFSQNSNPFFQQWDTPFGTPPFDKIEQAHYLPAFKAGIEEQNKEIDAIVNNTEEPTFENTIVALEYSDGLLTKVSNVFFAMLSSMTNDEMQAISKEVSPMLSKHNDDIKLNPELFARIKTVYENQDQFDLNTEQKRLLDEYYKSFVRGGANLSDEAKEKFRKINEELSLLSLEFGENVLKETNKFELVLEESDLDGLPESVIAIGADEAKDKGYEGKYVYTIQRTSLYPFLTYSTRRDLREKLYKGYILKGDNNDELDNKKKLSRMAALRVERANLLGYDTHADFVLEERMAKTSEAVYELLNKLWEPALKVAKKERDDMQQMIYDEGDDFELESWDWWYYSEKVKKAKYDLDEEELRPYFEVTNVIKGVFDLSTRLWGITFEERDDITKYHPEVKTFEVKDRDGSHIGILYTDYFPRASKRGGAWMSSFRKQHVDKDGVYQTPIIYNVGNFSKPTADKPALLSIDNVNTLFHEFGHALHGLLSNTVYPTLSGTSTPRDFVEFPSQVMENWCMHPDVLKNYAFHYETGDPIPGELIQKIENSGKFNQGFATVEYLAASFLDMDWHTFTEAVEHDAIEFENASMNKIGLIKQIVPRYRSTYFNHIFAGGYSAGYYSYIWSEVLDADAFAAFEETGDVYNQELANKYREFILSKGGTDDAMELYKKFRGQEPAIEPLLERRGLN
ncbi:dipeptidyl carboxypeptidase dcp [hydrocarbon metagenome]|uniref:Dipeptidyl carboxypeptidase dcp n=1 Tax=hydrocarbon metagenome TaxID=938273 RepID=A0A0W8FVX7_9ZZZZ